MNNCLRKEKEKEISLKELIESEENLVILTPMMIKFTLSSAVVLPVEINNLLIECY